MSQQKFHLSLNVRDLHAMARFLEVLLGTRPALLHSDYAKFELDEPPLVLSLAPTIAGTDASPRAALNHLGFRLVDAAALTALEERLAAADVAYTREENVACCHSRQTKLWVDDPAGNLWELYVLEEAGTCDGTPVALTPRSVKNSLTPAPLPSIWTHRLGEPLPDRIPRDDATLDEVVLEGTFNAALPAPTLARLLSEAARTLHSSGRLSLRCLAADRALEDPPRLPGPAAMVARVPAIGELMAAIERAGFIGLRLVTYGETYCFTHGGTQLRETRLTAHHAGPKNDRRTREVIYRGPLAEVRDDSGQTFPRGQRVCVDESTWLRLQQSSATEFIFLDDMPVPPDGAAVELSPNATFATGNHST